MTRSATPRLSYPLRILLISFLISTSFLSAPPAAVKAATHTLYVDVAADYDFGASGASACADSRDPVLFPEAIDCSLRGAIARANWQVDPAEGDPDNDDDVFIIDLDAQFPGEVFYLNRDPVPASASQEDANVKGDLDILGHVEIVGRANPADIVIDARDPVSTESLDRVFDIRPGASAVIEGVTIQYGLPRGTIVVDTRNYPEPGGGIRNQGSLTLHNAVVGNNRTNDGTSTPGGYGGGIYNSGMMNADGLTVQDNFTGAGQGSGSNEGGGGGGIFNASGGVLTLLTSAIKNNHTGAGGPGYTGGSGGGLYNDNVAILNTVTFEGNYTGAGTSGSPGGGAGGDGGAIFNNNQGDLNIQSSAFTANRTGKGGLGQNTAISGGTGGNGGKGGAIANSGSISNLKDTLFEGNQTGAGGDCSLNEESHPGIAGNGGLGGAIANGQSGDIGDGTASAIIFTLNNNHTGAGGKCDGTGTGGHGGGVYNDGNIVSPLQASILNNYTGPGGAVLDTAYIQGGDGGDGGGIYNSGQIRYQGSGFQLGIDHSIISGNNTGMGGAGGSGPLSGVSIGGNGGDGGGIFNRGTIAAIRFTTFDTNNTGSGYGTFLTNDPDIGGDGGDGGAVYTSGDITEISYSLMLGNYTGRGGDSHSTGSGGMGGRGGAIALFSYGRVSRLFNSTLTQNYTGKGGRGASENFDGIGGDGGGIYSQENGWIDVRMSTIVDNRTYMRSYGSGPTHYIPAGHGAGIYVNHAELFSVVGSIISDNPRDILNASGQPAIQWSDCAKMPGEGLQSLGFNVIRNPVDDTTVPNDNTYKCSVFTSSAGKYGPDIVGQDPIIQPSDPLRYFSPAFEEDNPSVTSPAIDLVPMRAGMVTLCGFLDPQLAAYVDQLSHQRPLGSRCDAGSVEIGGTGGENLIFLPTVRR